jgi:TrmH family RNA methyltransferase
MKKLSETASAARGRLRRIEGRHNPLVKLLRQAFAGADCTSDGHCAVEGLRIVEEAIRSGLRFRAVFFRESEQDLAERLLPQIGAHVETLLLPNKIFDNAVPSETPQGVAALVHLKEFSFEEIMARLRVGPLVVIAGLQDPGNLGTILRSAEAFGGAGVILGEGTVSPFNAKVVRASAGSIFRVPVIREKLDAVCSRLRAQEIRLVATSSHKGTPLGEARLSGPLAMFIGNEGSGLPRDLMTRMDEAVVIPHAPQVESLNAGVATSILLYEAARQRN